MNHRHLSESQRYRAFGIFAVQLPGRISDEATEKLKHQWLEIFGGEDNAPLLIILEEGATFVGYPREPGIAQPRKVGRL